MKVGYGCVNAVGESFHPQRETLEVAGCDDIHNEDQTCPTGSTRLTLNKILAKLADGDTLVVTRLDRIADSLEDLHGVLTHLSTNNIDFKCVQQSGLNLSRRSAKVTLAVVAALAEFERDLLVRKRSGGSRRTLTEGIKRRLAPVDSSAVRALKAQGFGPAAIAKHLGIGRSSVYRALAKG